MRVLIDARSLGERATSNRTYWAELIGALGRRSELELVLASNVPLPESDVPPNGRVVLDAKPGRWFSLVTLPAIAKRMADVVHVQYTVSPRFRTPVVTMVHDVSFFIEPSWFGPKDRTFLRASVPASCRRAARVVAPSESCKREILEYIPLAEEKVIVTPHGVPSWLSRTEPAIDALTELVRDWPFVLLVGGASPRKNLRGAIEAVARARETAPDLCLLVTGKLPEPPKEAWVIAPGPLSEPMLLAAYGEARALLHPSYHEGFGLTVLEAMAAGCPAVASDRGAIPEVAGDAAILCDPLDTAGMAEGLLRLLDPADRAQKIEKGRERAARYTWDESASRTVEAYRQAIGGSEPLSPGEGQGF